MKRRKGGREKRERGTWMEMKMENEIEGRGDEEERNGRVGLDASVTRPLIGQAPFSYPDIYIIISFILSLFFF
jgi:hypothetical protein